MTDNLPLKQTKDTLSVKDIIRLVKLDIETVFPDVVVAGEISRFNVTVSGHCYFTLKDEVASVSCVMFSSRYAKLGFEMKEGVRYIVFCRPTMYDKRGEFQLNIYGMIEEGEGKLAIEFEKLKKKLREKGYFDDGQKKELPYFPKSVGIVTSSTGAALRDILSVSFKRAPNIDVIIYPSLVQGKEAPLSIANAIKLANKRREIDVLILARGGGSADDLSCFNDETVANAVHKSVIPIVSAVGHEVDITIADLVADKRVETPTAAAQMVFPDTMSMRKNIFESENKIISIIENRIERIMDRLRHYSPKYFLSLIEHKYEDMLRQHDNASERLDEAIKNIVEKNKTRFVFACDKLDLLSPVKVLSRGYSRVTKNGKTVISVGSVKKDDIINILLADGGVKASVLELDERGLK